MTAGTARALLRRAGWLIVLAGCRSAGMPIEPDAAIDADPAPIEVLGAPRCEDAPTLPADVVFLDPGTSTTPSGTCFGNSPRRFYRAPWPAGRALLVWTPEPRFADLRVITACGVQDQAPGCELVDLGRTDYDADHLYLDDGVLGERSVVLATNALYPTRLEVRTAAIDRREVRGTCAAPTPLAARTVVFETGADDHPSGGCATDVRAIALPARSTLRHYGGLETARCCEGPLWNESLAPTVAYVSGFAGEPYAYDTLALPANTDCAGAAPLGSEPTRVELDLPSYDVFEATCGEGTSERRWFTLAVPPHTRLTVTLDGGADDGTGVLVAAVDACGGACVATSPALIGVASAAIQLDNPGDAPRAVRIVAAQFGAGIANNVGVLHSTAQAL